MVNGAGPLLNHQAPQKSSSSRVKDDKSFQEALDNAQAPKKRKPLEQSAKKPVSKDKKKDNDSFDNNERTLRTDNNPRKMKEDQLTQQPTEQPTEQKSLVNKQESPIAKDISEINQKMNEIQAKREAALASVASLEATQEEVALSEQGSQLLKDENLSKENVLSNNLSDSKLKALEKNVEKLEKFEKSFSDHVNTEVEKSEKASDAKGLKALSGQGAMPIPQEMKTESTPKQVQLSESLEGQNTQGLQGIKLNNFTDDQGSSEQNTDMNSMFGQGFEQEASVDKSKSSFVEAMNEVDMKGQKSEKIDNMQSIVRQARAFIKDGGGTMKMELSPEGMGKVHLKVAVANGQVNVEMLADNQIAKKALEDGLSEIKVALEGHKLMVDTLKVEMSQDIQSDFSDLRDHMQEQANRDFAQDFLGQFRQDRDAKYGGLFDGFKNFNPGQKEPVLNLNSRNNPYTAQGKGQTLNVVA